jgi:hypothetical protein
MVNAARAQILLGRSERNDFRSGQAS